MRQSLVRTSRSIRRLVRLRSRGPVSGLDRSQRLHRRRVGRAGPRGHDVQRDQNVSDDGRRVGVAERAHPRRERPCARLHASRRRFVRRAAQPADHVGPSAAADERLAGHALGQARLGRSARGRLVDWPNRKLYEPGTHYKYNDVRVNVMALALLHVLRTSAAGGAARGDHGADWRLVHVALVRLREFVGRDRRPPRAVGCGGGHWGGGMHINAYDMARFGYLFLRNGKWKDQTLVSEQWIKQARTPGTANAEYGYANWYLNTERKPLPGNARVERPLQWRRPEHHLHRLGERPGRRGALDAQRCAQ